MHWLYFGLFTKIKCRARTSFCCTFSAYFFHENFSRVLLHFIKWPIFSIRSSLFLKILNNLCFKIPFNPLNANPTKWSNILKQFVNQLIIENEKKLSQPSKKHFSRSVTYFLLMKSIKMYDKIFNLAVPFRSSKNTSGRSGISNHGQLKVVISKVPFPWKLSPLEILMIKKHYI